MGLNSTDRSKLVILAVVGLLYSGGVAYLLQSTPGPLYHDDFFQRWYATKMLLTTGRSLYDWANAYEAIPYVGWPYAFDLRFYYPAYLIFITAPLSWLPYPAVIFLWRVSGLWLLWLSMVIVARSLEPGLSINQLTWLLGLMTTSVPVLQHTIYAQFNGLGVLALILTYLALSREKYFLAGIGASGLLFKPQATLLPLLVLLAWSALTRKRRLFWVSFGLIALLFWAIPELLEPNWAVSCWQSLSSYPPSRSVISGLWNPYQLVSLALALITAWFTFKLRHLPASSPRFEGLLVWSVGIAALITPLYAMMHFLLMGPALVIGLNGLSRFKTAWIHWVWGIVFSLFIAGVIAFAVPLGLVGMTGLHIASAEAVYKIATPLFLVLLSLPLMFSRRNAPNLP